MVLRDAPIRLLYGLVAPDKTRPDSAHTPRTIAEVTGIFIDDGHGRPWGRLL